MVRPDRSFRFTAIAQPGPESQLAWSVNLVHVILRKRVTLKVLRRLPLSLTVFRVLLGPAFLVAHSRLGQVWVLFLIVGLAIVTDWLDGLAARRLQAVSVAGKLLDPFADALFCMIVFFDFAAHGLMPWWILVILLCREAIITFILRPFALVRGIVVAAGRLGKTKTAFQFVVMLFVLSTFSPAAGKMPLLVVLKQVSFFAVLGLSLASAGRYAFDVRACLSGSRRTGRTKPLAQEGR